jgi:molybdenum cofactor biosynthesis enzyme MoaA
VGSAEARLRHVHARESRRPGVRARPSREVRGDAGASVSAIRAPRSSPPFDDGLRRAKSTAYDVARFDERAVAIRPWGVPLRVYGNANLSVYSAQACNARCPFGVEELRPASRGGALALQKELETDDARYFAALDETLRELSPLGPSVSVTGGEPSKDPRLPRILTTLAAHGARKRTLTTNGSGLLDVVDGRPLVDWIAATGLSHLNVSRAHPDTETSARMMGLPDPLPLDALARAVAHVQAAGTRVRLSCVLVKGGVDDLDGVLAYVAFARSIGVSEVIFRQLMRSDPASHAPNFVVAYSDARRVLLEPILDAISADPRFTFVRQIVGYYYYVECWRLGETSVVFEEADLANLERVKRALGEDAVHELVFHPNARLASTWQPWDGVIGPIRSAAPGRPRRGS